MVNDECHLQKIQLGGCDGLLLCIRCADEITRAAVAATATEAGAGVAQTGGHAVRAPFGTTLGPGQRRAKRIVKITQRYTHYSYVVRCDKRYGYHLSDADAWRCDSMITNSF